ncbi:cobyrinate a,c-diamide synthase [Chromobacterium subtsugae]|uniref:Cobyrinate a,c-diamide synthase n=1 Tax=Chromobacterium subtsugae TaxID=251747 RepID=A0ABS7FAT5_9NEIS|nr:MULTISPECIES: cobyrinate a,c-diamide synthase [Chromobacterium]KUM04749.1 cobyrinic acid a,c-diamide synthase [Chromobacterium subtsugae]KZE85662.1 cobyrinic acid a,c-diamide synthase [Chromobacterium sp. F49]MBW7566068.1 cobyrinate a,c-diamide synthase [Chromobacterium subtsugae]MBW8287189.1 cobyrinate a,c-diamide synthase [Chromobacterium subtsugae]OBU87368.1 cobyrinic acid a,c-diamide synthase [Chromobacterium subtsugae]
METRHCPALFLTAPASHQGKTTLTAALARHHRKQGRRVRVFKTGPDFLDPYILEQASGHTVYGLDLWMNGEDDCRARLHQAAAEADLILIEGSMGLFDGTPSSADLAELLGVPLVAVIDAAGMAQTFAAVAHGLASFRPGLVLHGLVANHVASERHAEMLAQQLPVHLPLLAALRRDEAARLPERHLGLVQAQEIADLDARLERSAAQIAGTALAALPPPAAFPAIAQPAVPRQLAGKRIAIARDAAFAFVYPANLETLRQLGAELAFFSPLADAALPDCDAVYLPGGYPELHLETLSANTALKADLHGHVEAGKPLYAECGGMLYLLDRLTNRDNDNAAMLGLLPGHATLQARLCGLGLQQMDFPGGALRGHTFHYTRLETALEPIARAERASGAGQGEALYRRGSLLASYFHAYFPSNPLATASLFLS